jgi:hypothetical protein
MCRKLSDWMRVLLEAPEFQAKEAVNRVKQAAKRAAHRARLRVALHAGRGVGGAALSTPSLALSCSSQIVTSLRQTDIATSSPEHSKPCVHTGNAYSTGSCAVFHSCLELMFTTIAVHPVHISAVKSRVRAWYKQHSSPRRNINCVVLFSAKCYIGSD